MDCPIRTGGGKTPMHIERFRWKGPAGRVRALWEARCCVSNLSCFLLPLFLAIVLLLLLFLPPYLPTSLSLPPSYLPPSYLPTGDCQTPHNGVLKGAENPALTCGQRTRSANIGGEWRGTHFGVFTRLRA